MILGGVDAPDSLADLSADATPILCIYIKILCWQSVCPDQHRSILGGIFISSSNVFKVDFNL